MTEPLDRELPPAYDEARIASTWQRIAARRWPAARPPRRWLLGGLVAVAALAIAIVAWPAHRAGPLASRDRSTSVLPGTIWTAGRDVALDDDSTISLAAGARLEILANEGARFATQLQRGRAHFDVHPDGPRRWEIETALASVEVVGTAFTVELRDDQLEVAVERGVVLVHGERVPGRVARLTAGMHLVIGPPAITAAVAPDAPMVVPSPPPAPARHEVPVHPRAQESLAEAIAKADLLTGEGDAAGAAALLERHRSRRDGLVLFTLGRLYLDALGKPELAAAAFDEVIVLASPQGLLEDAHARKVLALVQAGHREGARAALGAYETAFPRGRRLAALRMLVGP